MFISSVVHPRVAAHACHLPTNISIKCVEITGGVLELHPEAQKIV